MILYHGSNHIIDKPLYGAGKKYNDYGIGFYFSEYISIKCYFTILQNTQDIAFYSNILPQDIELLSNAFQYL